MTCSQCPSPGCSWLNQYHGDFGESKSKTMHNQQSLYYVFVQLLLKSTLKYFIESILICCGINTNHIEHFKEITNKVDGKRYMKRCFEEKDKNVFFQVQRRKQSNSIDSSLVINDNDTGNSVLEDIPKNDEDEYNSENSVNLAVEFDSSNSDLSDLKELIVVCSPWKKVIPTKPIFESKSFLKELLFRPNWLVPDFAITRNIQCNYLEVEVNDHPCEIQGISWNRLNKESYRLVSFANFPNDSSVFPLILASKGFAYLGNGTDYKIICCFCTVQIDNQDDMKNIDEVHAHMSKDCPMLRNSSDNISMRNTSAADANFVLAQFFHYKQNREQDNGVVPANQSSSAVYSEQASSAIQASSQAGVSAAQAATKLVQPSNEGASSVLVTNTSDLAEGDLAEVTQTSQSSQLMDDSSTVAQTLTPPSVANPSQPAVPPSSQQVQGVPSSNNTTSGGPTDSSNSGQSVDSTSNDQQDNSQQDGSNSGGQGTSYEELGIITARPKRPEYAVLAIRMNSFNEWPTKHHMKAVDLAKAGYFYTGYSDCARCFYCGGGLRNWEPQDNVWVEHARWFPKCAFLRQEVGTDFINTIQAMSKERDEITYEDVTARMQISNAPTPLQFKERLIERDPAVLTVVDNGFEKNEILKLALEIMKEGEILSSDKLYEQAQLKKLPVMTNGHNLASDSVSIRKGGNESRDKDTITALREDNGELRQQTICKICMDTEVAVVFLPCGHFVSCTECSCALTACPVCRLGIKGIVRAYMG